MKKFTITAFLLLVTLWTEAQTVTSGVVFEVVEGDIIKILTPEGDTLPIKFRNIECPEINQSYGDKARNFTRKLCLKQNITVSYDEFDRDRNALGTVVLANGEDVGATLVEQGLAWHYMKGLSQAQLWSLP